jgi:GDPmannose 4,6-dehydratase
MLPQAEGDDYVIATGQSRSVGELIETAFAHVGLTPGDHVVVDPEFVRPHDPVPLVGDPSKAHAKLGWAPRTPFADMIGAMVEADLALLSAGASV